MDEAYLDIETTGLSCPYADITVIGIYLVNNSSSRLVELAGKEVTSDNLLESLNGVNKIYAYNGRRFELAFVHDSLEIDLADVFHQHDLMYDCWRCNRKGGFKAAEQQPGIPRQLKGMSGWDAVIQWWRYQQYGDRTALATLLQYNKEDVMNLKALRERLDATGVRG
jgi:hypothetical protein